MYHKSDRPLTYWRSQTHQEVDVMVGDDIAIEVKATHRITSTDLKGLQALDEAVPLKRQIIVSRESTPRWINSIEILPLENSLQQLRHNELFTP